MSNADQHPYHNRFIKKIHIVFGGSVRKYNLLLKLNKKLPRFKNLIGCFETIP